MKITCHMITSLDGRLLPERWDDPADGTIDALVDAHYEAAAEALDADGWIVGRRTMAAFTDQAEPMPLLNEPLERPPHLADRGGRAVAVAIDPGARLRFPRGHIDDDHPVVVLCERVPDERLAALRETGVSYVFAGPDGDQLARAMETLAGGFGLRHLLLEGGGVTNGAFLAAGLIDRFSTLICPTVDGLAGVPSILEAAGPAQGHPAAGQHLRLTACETLDGGVVWLRHDVIHDRRRNPMMRLTALALTTALASPAALADGMEITRNGSRDGMIGPADKFTGTAYIEPVFSNQEPFVVNGGKVTFLPGARSNWHTHPAGQVLVVTEGKGWVQEEGKARQVMKPGDVVWCPPGVKHWHGATDTTAVTHMAVQQFKDGKNVVWLEPVSDDQYHGEQDD
tara:strand:+ start:131204 stop:132394 length:1191 start_codon:yes stop_codon:yes gene_type:complete